jgi:hypothetical protein
MNEHVPSQLYRQTRSPVYPRSFVLSALPSRLRLPRVRAPCAALHSYGATPLMLASHNGHADALQLLLHYKAAVNAQNNFG